MPLRPKTARRVIAVVLAAGAVGLGGTIVYRHKQAVRADVLEQVGRDGKAAFDRADYVAALPLLSQYAATHNDDPTAIYGLAMSRQAIELPNARHLAEARGLLLRVLSLEPGHDRAELALLELNAKCGYVAEVLELSQKRLERNPDDLIAIRLRAAALSRQMKFADALAAMSHYTQLAPADVASQLDYLQLLLRTGATPRTLVAHGDKLVETHPEPWARLVRAAALRLAQRPADAAAALESLVNADELDTALTLQIVQQLEALDKRDAAQQLLTKQSDRNTDLLLALVERLWQRGQYLEICDRLSDMPASPPARLLALHCAAQFSLEPTRTTTAMLATLKNMDTPVAHAWHTALTAEFASQALPPRQRVEQLRLALSQDAGNAIFYSWLAQQLEQMGEADQALIAYRNASQSSPEWAEPRLGMSRLLLSMNKTQDAVTASAQAYQLDATSGRTLLALATARYADLSRTADAGEAQRLLNLCEQIQARVPGETGTLPIRVALLARSQRPDEAIAVTRQALAAFSPPNTQTLATLLSVSVQYRLGLSDEIIAYAKTHDRVSPELILSRCVGLLQRQQRTGALQLMNEHLASHSDSPQWQLASAQLLDLAGDSSAVAAWKTLAAKGPLSLPLCNAILASSSGTRDSALAAQAIAGLKEIAGVDSRRWRLETARQLLISGKPEDAREAVTLLSNLLREDSTQTDLRIELARAMEATGNVATAIEHLTAATAAAPTNARAALPLASLLRRSGRTGESLATLQRLASVDQDEPQARVQIASMLIDAGDTATATTLLLNAQRRGLFEVQSTLMLADLQNAAGKTAEARSLFARLLAAPEQDAVVLTAAASFYANAGDVAAARETLARLSSASISPLARALSHARYAASTGNTSAAASAYDEAIPLAADDRATLLEAVQFDLKSRDYDRAIGRIVRTPAWQSQPRLASLMAQASVLKTGIQTSADLERLVAALSLDSQNSLEARTLLTLQLASQSSSPALAASLTDFAAAYPTQLPLQARTAALLLSRGEVLAALSVTQRVVSLKLTPQQFASDPASTVSLASTLLALADARDDRALAKQAATLLASLAGNESIVLLRAEALRQAGDNSGASALLRPLASKNAAASNLLAYVMLRSGDAASAEPFAAAAVEQSPLAAHFDTLARVQMAQNNLAAAATSFAHARDADPTYIDAILGLAKLEQSRGDSAAVSRLVGEADRLLAASSREPQRHLHGELNALRQAISKTE